MTPVPSIVRLRPLLGPWSPLHSAGGWIKTMKVYPLFKLLNPDKIYITTACPAGERDNLSLNHETQERVSFKSYWVSLRYIPTSTPVRATKRMTYAE